MAKPAVTVAPKQSPLKENKSKDSLQCEYKRPLWWSNAEQRKQMKETIKTIIKRTKTTEKAVKPTGSVNHAQPMGADTPPGLSHSLPTSATYSATPQTRLPSDGGSPYSHYHDFNQPPPSHDPFNAYYEPHVLSPPYDTNPYYTQCAQTPYEVDIKTERQMYVDDIPTRKDSSTSTFSTFHPPPGVNPFSSEDWAQDGMFENTGVFGVEQGPEYDFYAHAPPPPLASSHSVHIEVDDCDRPLLDHFIDNVLRLTLPIYEVNVPGSARSSVVLPALATNKCYLHCCLSMAAIHLKSTQRRQDEQIDGDIMRHRVECVQALCAAINDDHHQVLDATLGMIFFPCSVGGAESDLPDIPWHSHFEAASSLVRKLQLQHTSDQHGGEKPHPSFNMSLATWIDIIGATMLGRSPLFADAYRVKNERGTPSGLSDVMGCDDRVMYMISEIACLDALKASQAIDGYQVCELVRSLGEHLDATEPRSPLEHAVSPTGAIRPKHLATNVTSVFRLAARIYLCGLVPDANRQQDHMKTLVERLTTVLEYIPAGPEGFDRSLVWPLLIGGSMSTPNSRFRMVLDERIARLGEHSEFGSFGRTIRLLREVWRQSDEVERAGEERSVHWRDVMRQKGWDFLLI
ncbi:uncharacterized protein KY384_001931 [Bacidia gigantensis]|uniref:uncharacterized protein n=1 Tax=Bacidia gigantensis TaxID=2732470 RepID=UPI001D03D336|nr:uncharacterized protein KY384_001931 [Bacidia gigantensis]KAG8533148.1 hypothetical protein KY384_001931 [Bacidia gigantensis]